MSDDLVTGTDTGGWGMPAGIYNYCTGKMEYGGAIWYGDEPPTQDDYRELCDLYGFQVQVDIPTLFGGPSHRDRVKDDDCYQAPTVVL